MNKFQNMSYSLLVDELDKNHTAYAQLRHERNLIDRCLKDRHKDERTAIIRKIRRIIKSTGWVLLADDVSIFYLVNHSQRPRLVTPRVKVVIRREAQLSTRKIECEEVLPNLDALYADLKDLVGKEAK